MLAERKGNMHFVLRNIVEFFNSQNATYWLDYGTLLGVVREGDVLLHDGDIDISRLADDLNQDRY